MFCSSVHHPNGVRVRVFDNCFPSIMLRRFRSLLSLLRECFPLSTSHTGLRVPQHCPTTGVPVHSVACGTPRLTFVVDARGGSIDIFEGFGTGELSLSIFDS